MRSNNFNNKFMRKLIVNISYIIIALMLSIVVINIASAETTLEQDVASFGRSALGKLSGQSNTKGVGNDPIQGTGKLVDFYNRNQSLIDFFIMFALFCSIALIGLKKTGFGESGGNAMKGLAIAVGAALAIAALKAGYSPSFFVPFVKNFLFLIIFFVIFMVIKATMSQNVLLAFILALVITWVAFNVANLVLEGKENKFDMANVFKLMAGSPTDTDEQRRLSNIEVRQTQDELDALYEEKGRLEELIGNGEYKSKFLVEQARESEKDEKKKANLMRLFDVMGKIEELEAKMQKEMGKRFDYDKQNPTTPKLNLRISDDKTKLICTIDPTTGKMSGAPENVNKDIKYRFEFSVDGNVKKYYDIDYKDRATEQTYSLEKEGVWKCKVYAYIETYGKTPDQVTPGEAMLDYLGAEHEADKTAFETNKAIIESEREATDKINGAVAALKGLKGRTYYNRNKNEIDKFINAGEIKVKAINVYKEVTTEQATIASITGTTATEIASKKKAKIDPLISKIQEVLNIWKPYRGIDTAFDALLDNKLAELKGSSPDTTIPNFAGKRNVDSSSGQKYTLTDDDEFINGQPKGEYGVKINFGPKEIMVAQKQTIRLSISLDSEIPNKFRIIFGHAVNQVLASQTIDETIDNSAKTINFEIPVTSYDARNSQKEIIVEVYDMDGNTASTNIVRFEYNVNVQPAGPIQYGSGKL
ncbi:hypothetical protein HYU06_00650 [Candidatus Woesearchaeota archaeon]|nr:hypothetical protein [Candidatus Woesearchaeota archaeon]